MSPKLKNHGFWPQFLFLIVLQLFASATLAGPLFFRGTLSGDTIRWYSLFRDNMHALNHFGQVGWWHPNLQTGFPLYYLSLLFNFASPLNVLLGAGVWLAGVLGFQIASFHGLYVAYFGLIIPFAVSFAFFLLIREIFDGRKVVYFLLVLTAFSPGAVYVLMSVNGLEQTCYAFFFGAAFLRFVRRPGKGNFWLCLAATMAVLLSLSLMSMLWTILFVPLWVGIVLAMGQEPIGERCRRMFSAVSAGHWAIAILAMALCAAAPILGLFLEPDIVRAGISTRFYGLDALRPGNPLELLTAGIPDVGFNWMDGRWVPHAAAHYFRFYAYLGALVLPLALVGLSAGRDIWRPRMLLVLIVATIVVPMVSASPLFLPLLQGIPALKANRHFSDDIFRVGTAYMLMIAAGLGLEQVLQGGKKAKVLLIAGFALAALWSAAYQCILYGKDAINRPMFGFFVVLVCLFVPVLVGLLRAQDEKQLARYFKILVFLTLIDVSTVAFWHMRNHTLQGEHKIPEAAAQAIGMGRGLASSYSEILLEPAGVRALREQGTEVNQIPLLGFAGGTGDIAVEYQTYNTLTVAVLVDRKTHLQWRDAFSPHWRATVNGQPTPIRRSQGAYKAVPIPQGSSIVRFSFTPQIFALLLVLAHAILLAVLITALTTSRP